MEQDKNRNDQEYLASLLEKYRTLLSTDIAPFWINNAIDWTDGGIFTAISDSGEVISTDKYIWSNARAIYTFSALYNRVENRQIWADAAENIFDFCLRHGRDKEGTWRYLVDRQGNRIEGEKAIQVDAFAIMGLVEYARMTGDKKAVDAALETFESTTRRLAKPGSYGTFPYPIPEGYCAHRDYFQFAFAFFELGHFLKDSHILEQALSKANVVMDHFRVPRHRGLVEYVDAKTFKFVDEPWGRTMVPGHAIESMWFMMHIFSALEPDGERIGQAVQTIRDSVQQGWDPQFGGIFLGIDILGKSEPKWRNWDTKIWWVFVEALYALLLSHEATGEQWCLEWYRKVHDWSFAHFPVPEHGEWTQKLDREGKLIDRIIALPVKDPFHLPRAFILITEVLDRLTTGKPAGPSSSSSDGRGTG